MIDIASTLSIISTTTPLIKECLNKIKDKTVRKKVEELLSAIIPLQSHIITLQSVNTACTKEKEGLEKKLREIENWIAESSQYELSELAFGVFVYKTKAKFPGPIHYLCTNCFDTKRQESILQFRRHSSDGVYYTCNNCKSSFLDHSKSTTVPDSPQNGTRIPVT